MTKSLGLAIMIALFAPAALAGAGAGCHEGPSSLSELAAGDVPVTLRFEAVPLPNILDALRRAADFRLVIEDDLGISATIEVTKTPLREVLEVLAARYGLRYEVPDAGALVVRATTQKVIDGVTPPELLSKVPPVYPDSARAARRQGRVVLTAIVEADGTVGEVSVLKHSADPALDESAIEAVRQWRYRPAIKDGNPVQVVFQVVVDFQLGNQKPGDQESAAL